jgi:hypothetical protein
MLIQGQVGPSSPQSVAPGTPVAVRQGQLGDVVVSELHGRYYEQAYRRNLFSGAISGSTGVTASALGVITATAYTGLVLYNPPSSPVNLVLNKVGYAFPIAPAAATVVSIGTGVSQLLPISTTAVTTRNNYVTGPAAVGQLYSVATFGITTSNPVTTTPQYTLGWVGTQAATGTGQAPHGVYDLEGSIVIPPTGFACIYLSTVANTNGFFGHFAWEEVPV